MSNETDTSPVTAAQTAETKPAPKTAGPKTGKKKKRKKKRRKHAGILVFLIVLLVLILAALGAAGWFGMQLLGSDTILPGVRAGELDLSGMTEAQAEEALRATGMDEQYAEAFRVQLPGDIVFKVDRYSAGTALRAGTVAQAAASYGHSGSLLDALGAYAQAYLNGVDVLELEGGINSEYLYSRVDEGIAKFEALTVYEEYTIDRDEEVMVMVKGAGQLKLDRDELYTAITEALLAGKTELNYDPELTDVTMPDFAAIYADLAVEPESAWFDTETKAIIPSVEGFTFDVNEAETVWAAAAIGERVRIPVDILYPETTTEDLNALLFRDLLGTVTTYYKSSNDNRINNIRLAASKVNGFILCPDEVFSYNGTVGQRTREAGFLEAGAYTNGQVVLEVGGGICQVSSTIYCAMMYANLETVERSNHMFRVDYLNLGWDATVSWPGPDLKFRNNREYPVKIVVIADTEARSLTVEFWGTNTDGSYVELGYDRYAIYDPEYPDVLIGYGAQGFRKVYNADGSFRERINERYGTYNLHDYEIKYPEEVEEPEDDTGDSGGSTDPGTDSGGGGSTTPGSTDSGGSGGDNGGSTTPGGTDSGGSGGDNGGSTTPGSSDNGGSGSSGGDSGGSSSGSGDSGSSGSSGGGDSGSSGSSGGGESSGGSSSGGDSGSGGE